MSLSILDTMTPAERDATEPSPADDGPLPLCTDPGDVETVRRYRAEIARILGDQQRKAG